MKKKILLFTAVIAISSYLLSGYREGPMHESGWDCTGAEFGGLGDFNGPQGCTTGSCHGSALTSSISVSIELDSAGGVPTTHYVGGQTYQVKIKGTNSSGLYKPYHGFQLTNIIGADTAPVVANAGAFDSIMLPAITQISTYTRYSYLHVIEHSDTIPTINDTFSETFTWYAPPAGTGVISFWGAANFVNGNGQADTGDYWNTNHIVIYDWSTLSVASAAKNINITSFPNPVINTINLQINDAEGNYHVTVYDLSGRIIVQENINATGNNFMTSFNTADMLSGMYYMNVSKDGNSIKVIPFVKR